MNDKCTMCGQEGLVKLSSQNAKVCTGCGHEEAWPLEAGQQPLVGSHRQKKVSDPAQENAEIKAAMAQLDIQVEGITTGAESLLRNDARLITEAEREALFKANEMAWEQLGVTQSVDHDPIFRAINVLGNSSHQDIMKRIDCLTDLKTHLFGHKLDRLLQHIAPDDSMFRNYQAELRSLSNTIAATHTCYEKGDEGCPEQILDGNGDIVLSQCKHCGAGESELSQQVCTGVKKSPLQEVVEASIGSMVREAARHGWVAAEPTAQDTAPQIDPDHIRRSYRFADVCEPNYLQLALVLQRAHDQAAYGKGKDRHAKGQPFHEQRMQAISQLLDSEDGMAYQVLKKVTEGLELPTTERKVAELLGAINYLAGIVIFLESKDRDNAVNIIAGEV